MFKLARIDLSSQQIQIQHIPKSLLIQFLGGSGLSSWIIYRELDPRIDPLSPQNLLVIMTGILTGTGAPGMGRFTICSKSPLTGIWGESSCGGDFGSKLRYSGYDGLIIHGRSEDPVYIHIDHGEIDIHDASQLWGLDTAQTHSRLRSKHGSVICIGPAGERKISYACIMHGGRAAGRTGLGAVMGSKNLKAILVEGDSRPHIQNPQEFNQTLRELNKFLVRDPGLRMLSEYGTAGFLDLAARIGDLPSKYWSQGIFEDASKIGGMALRKLLIRKYRCHGCPVGCGRIINHRGMEIDGPEYETLASFGSQLLISDLEAICEFNRICNLQGLDTISTGNTIALAIHLFQQGIIPQSHVGFELRWGDPDLVLELLEMIVAREGFGEILARGSSELAARYGALDQAAQVKGLEIPMHDPRAFSSMAIAYATSNRGACHLRGMGYMVELGVQYPDLGILKMDRRSDVGKGAMMARLQDLMCVYDSLVMCKFLMVHPDWICRMLNSAMGTQITPGDLIKIGERIFNLQRCFNIRCGISAEKDVLPKILLTPLDGPTKGFVPDLQLQLREYYSIRGWEPDGKPSKSKLLELGLEFAIQDLYPG